MVSKSNEVQNSEDGYNFWAQVHRNAGKNSAVGEFYGDLRAYSLYTTLLLMALLFMTLTLLFPTDGSRILLVQGEVTPQ